MSDGTHADGEQLFDTKSDEVLETVTDTAETPLEQETQAVNPNDEQPQEGLKLEEPSSKDKAPDKAEEIKLQMIRKFQKDMDDGVKTIDQLPPAQAWMKEFLKAEAPKTSKEDIGEVVEQKMKEDRERADFARLKDSLEELATTEQKNLINERYAEFIKKGMNAYDALQLATEVAKVDLTGNLEQRRRMAIPQPSSKNPTTADIESMPFEEAQKVFPPEKIAEHLRNLVK